MQHPWFNLRLLIAGVFLSLWYVPLFAIGWFFNIPLWIMLLGLPLLLWVEYIIGVKRALRSVNATRITGETPGEQEFLTQVNHYASQLGVAMPKVSVGEFGSPNAFAVGRKGKGHIVFSQSLIALLEPDELAAVAVHELSHLHSRDSIPMVVGQGSAGIAYVMASIVGGFFDSGTHRGSVGTLTGEAAHLVVLVSLFAISRQREFVADADARAALGTGEPLVSALTKISTFTQQYQTPPLPEAVESLCLSSEWSLHGLTSTHPPVSKRIARLRDQR